MTLKQALFILRHGSAEGVKAYLEAVKVCEDEINRQKQEIERLQGIVLDVTATLCELEIRSEHIKAEAIKEFAERLATKIVNTPFGVNCSSETESYKDGCLHGLVAKQNNVLDMIYNLVKEMTEGKERNENESCT